jgi:hypothetical protein
MTLKELRKIVRQVESIYPAMLPISVSLKALKDCDGYTHIVKRNKKERIQCVLNSYPSTQSQLDALKESAQLGTLIHELAHAISWRPQRQEEGLLNKDHSEEWGIAVAKLYRLVLGED